MPITLSDQDKSTLRTAAYGAASLMAAACSPDKAATNGSVVALTSATGLVGHVLAAKAKDIELKGKTVAELADQVLPALTAAMIRPRPTTSAAPSSSPSKPPRPTRATPIPPWPR